uniref:Endonuclease/exonuclease/phosphatase domain-containing protein n=1 Tax=Brachypodium distachyon TaxID=15368 RepID=A0A341M898_BRADI
MVGSMKILNWNVRGLGNSDKNLLIMNAICSTRPDIVCLQETKLDNIDYFKAAQFLPAGLRTFFFQPVSNTSVNNKQYLLTTVYAPYSPDQRPAFFQSLNLSAHTTTGPWIILGDFNMRFLLDLEFVLRKHCKEKLDCLISWQSMMWKRRTKLNRCKLGDENSRFFHATANCQFRRNTVKVLEKDDIR